MRPLSLFRLVLDVFSTARCAACRAFLDEPRAALCAACAARIPLLGFSHCPSCGGRAPGGSPRCHPKTPYLLIAVTTYRSPEAQALVKALKYDGIADAAATMALLAASAAARAFGETFSAHGGWMAAPIPLHPKRERARGWNQSALFAEALAHHALFRGIPIVPALTRTRHTNTQTEQPNREARRANVAGCFAVASPDAVHGRNILLVDDVSTSGATLEEAARTLRHAGARRIAALVFAKA